MMRKTLAILTAAAMAAGSLSAGVCVYAADDATHIYVLTAPEDHGWTGSVATFAKEKVEEVNNDGKYTAELITSADASAYMILAASSASIIPIFASDHAYTKSAPMDLEFIVT